MDDASRVKAEATDEHKVSEWYSQLLAAEWNAVLRTACAALCAYPSTRDIGSVAQDAAQDTFVLAWQRRILARFIGEASIVPFATYADANGTFGFAALPPGRYAIGVARSRDGYDQAIDVRAGETTTISLGRSPSL